MPQMQTVAPELQALGDKVRRLKSQRATQLGNLVIATGADGLGMEVLAGLLLEGVKASAGEEVEERRTLGEAFFRRRQKGAAIRPSPEQPRAGDHRRQTASGGGLSRSTDI